jgi:DDE_Tnp_1-associated
VPADPSSSIPSGLAVLGHVEPLRPAETPHLLAYLATVTDPRARAGRRHPLVAILVLAAAAVLAGARSMAAIAEWAADAPQPVRAALGTHRDPLTGRWVVPTETTIRRTLGRLDGEALAAAIGAWLADRNHPGQRRRAVAVDGKTLRGAKRDGRRVHLLAAMDHATRTVLAQRQVDGAPGEVPAFQPLLADLELAGVVVTADALQTHADAAEFLVTGK